MKEFRCKSCNKLLGKYRECKVLEIKCPRCKTNNVLHSIDFADKDTQHSLDTAAP